MIVKSNLSKRATEYFGGDVQRFWIERVAHYGTSAFRLYRLRHGGLVTNSAIVHASTAGEARKMFNAMAHFADRKHSR